MEDLCSLRGGGFCSTGRAVRADVVVLPHSCRLVRPQALRTRFGVLSAVLMRRSGEMRCLCIRMRPPPPLRVKYLGGSWGSNPIPADRSGPPGGDFPSQRFRTPEVGRIRMAAPRMRCANSVFRLRKLHGRLRSQLDLPRKPSEGCSIGALGLLASGDRFLSRIGGSNIIDNELDLRGASAPPPTLPCERLPTWSLRLGTNNAEDDMHNTDIWEVRAVSPDHVSSHHSPTHDGHCVSQLTNRKPSPTVWGSSSQAPIAIQPRRSPMSKYSSPRRGAQPSFHRARLRPAPLLSTSMLQS